MVRKLENMKFEWFFLKIGLVSLNKNSEKRCLFKAFFIKTNIVKPIKV